MGTIPIGESQSKTVLVVGVDFTKLAPHVLRVARDLLQVSRRGELHVVTVVRPPTIPADVIGAIPAPGPSTDVAVHRARVDLGRLCEAALGEQIVAGGAGIDVQLHVRVGRAAEEIEQLAEDVAADVIVIEAHGRTGIARLLHRSVAAELSRNAPCSVLTVRPRRARPTRAMGTGERVGESGAPEVYP